MFVYLPFYSKQIRRKGWNVWRLQHGSIILQLLQLLNVSNISLVIHFIMHTNIWTHPHSIGNLWDSIYLNISKCLHTQQNYSSQTFHSCLDQIQCIIQVVKDYCTSYTGTFCNLSTCKTWSSCATLKVGNKHAQWCSSSTAS